MVVLDRDELLDTTRIQHVNKYKAFCLGVFLVASVITLPEGSILSEMRSGVWAAEEI